jgi:hypothetical protein
MISNDEAPLPMLLNLLSTTTGDFEKEIIDSILYVLNDVAVSGTNHTIFRRAQSNKKLFSGK